MKDDSQYMTTVTTATLELGIDIGRLERAFQIDAPWTVSSFLQRMGRTGRRESPPEMWFVMREDEPEARAMLPRHDPLGAAAGHFSGTIVSGGAVVRAAPVGRTAL